MPLELNILSKIIELGLSGLILFIIIKPTISWMTKSLNEKDEYIRKLINNHFEHSQIQHEQLLHSIHQLPEKITKALRGKFYKKNKK